MLIVADTVIRTYLPVALEAVGSKNEATCLRRLPKLMNSKNLFKAHSCIEQIRKDKNGKLSPLFDDALFWSQAMMWSAARGEVNDLKRHLEETNKSLREGLRRLNSN